MRVRELVEILGQLNQDDTVVVWCEPMGRYLRAEGVKTGEGLVEVAANPPVHMN